MPYADNGGVKIFYMDEGDGPPILLHHGLAGTHWTGSFVCAYLFFECPKATIRAR